MTMCQKGTNGWDRQLGLPDRPAQRGFRRGGPIHADHDPAVLLAPGLHHYNLLPCVADVATMT